MINSKRILAIIPARGGSKGIPRKNIKDLNGKPLIAYTIEEAKKSRYIDSIVVSTEDEEIAKVSKKYNAEVPFLRPKELSEDDTPGIEPIIYTIKRLQESGDDFDYIMCLQCTSPFRKTEHIDDALKKLINEDADSIVSVCESEVSPYWMKKIKNGIMEDFLDDIPFYSRRQEIPTTYRLNGAIYIAKREVLLKNKNWYTKNTLAYIMDKKSSIDIDEMIDFNFSEFLMKEDEHD
ncbi:cytidylyltransferase domain-containing protein [Desnuesiella massiliensis]|uniref:acylneuraminate cytidylyltransferase family protein n=1 Tax=Desnuesiella massiliensis TaxID=1650662 RepID=UPI0006E44BB9|nr:acylneuraminate cytidylyltransferase family protein [Desnuesiella massiliensis]